MADEADHNPHRHTTHAKSKAADRAALETSNLKTLKDMFGKMDKQLQSALPKFMTPERMIRVATTTVQRVPRLLQCAPVTVVGAVMQAAALGLEPDNITGSAYLVPFWNSKLRRLECTLIPGYRGLMQLARRSKEVTAFDAHVVKKGDGFDFEYGSNKFLTHKPAFAMALKAGKWELPKDGQVEPETVAAYMIAYYGNVKLADGRPDFQFHVMDRFQLDQAMEMTTSRDRETNHVVGPWIEHPDAMRTKTAIRRGAKLLPFSIELMTAVSLEERFLANKSQNLGALVADDLGVQFSVSDDEPEGEGGGVADDTGIDPALVKRIDDAFGTLGYREAQRTTKLQEFRDRLPALLEWLDAELLKQAKPAASSTAAPNGTLTPNGTNGSTASKPRSGKFRI